MDRRGAIAQLALCDAAACAFGDIPQTLHGSVCGAEELASRAGGVGLWGAFFTWLKSARRLMAGDIDLPVMIAPAVHHTYSVRTAAVADRACCAGIS